MIKESARALIRVFLRPTAKTAGSNGIATFRAILGRFRSSSKPEPIGGLDIGLVATSAAQRGGWWRGGTLKCITIRRARAIAFGFSLHDVGTTRRPLLALVALLEVVQSIRARARMNDVCGSIR